MAAPDPFSTPAFFLLLESGSYLLQEDGTSRFLLEPATVTGATIDGATRPSTLQLFPATVTSGVVTILAATRPSGTQLFVPIVNLGGVVAILTATLPAGSHVFVPTLRPDLRITTARIASTATPFAPSPVTTLTFITTAVIGWPVLDTQLFPPLVGQSALLPPPGGVCAQPADLPAFALIGCVTSNAALPYDATVPGVCVVVLPLDPG